MTTLLSVIDIVKVHIQCCHKSAAKSKLQNKCKEKLEILHLSIWIIEIKSNKVKEIIYTCNSTSGRLIPTSVVATLLTS